MNTKVPKIQDALAVLLYTSFYVFSNNSMGVYYMIGLVLLILVLQMTTSFRINFTTFSKYMFTWGAYCFISAIWAENSMYAIEKGVTILELAAVYLVLYVCFNRDSVDRLLKIVMWSGFLLSIYTILFVGVDSLTETLQEEGRMENSFANVNAIGMAACTSILISLYYFMFSKIKWYQLIFNIPAIYIVAASGSRKAFVMLIIGVAILYFFKCKHTETGNTGSRMVTIIASLVAIVGVGYFLSSSGLFGGTMYRMTQMMDAFTGNEADHSTLIRAYYREIGFEQFLKTPILGIGMGNGRLLALQFTGNDCYLHCNYAELAACGGILALGLYYWIYIYILKTERRIMKYDPLAYIIILLVVVHLIMDYGMVSYYSKSTFFMLMLFLIHVDQNKYINE